MLLLLLLLLLACASSTPTAPPTAPVAAEIAAPAASAPAPAAPAATREESVAELAAARAAGITLIDVRTPAEFAGGHVPGAVNIPLDQIEARIGELPEAGDIHLICAAGGRSAKATAMLAAKGRAAINVAGGTNAWIAEGLPIEK